MYIQVYMYSDIHIKVFSSNNVHRCASGYQPPSKILPHPPPPPPPLKSPNCPSPPFLGNPPFFIGFL